MINKILLNKKAYTKLSSDLPKRHENVSKSVSTAFLKKQKNFQFNFFINFLRTFFRNNPAAYLKQLSAKPHEKLNALDMALNVNRKSDFAKNLMIYNL